MRKITTVIIGFLLLVVLPGVALSQVTASIDRDSIVIDETLSLMLTKDGSSFFSGPDLEPLQKDFKVLGQSQSSSTRIVNGASTSSAQWHIVLSPLRTGKLDIPPIEVGKDKSNPLSVLVHSAAEAKTKADGAPIFIESDIDSRKVHVQEQVLLTLRIYWAIEASIADPSDPEIEDSLVKRLEDTTFDKMVNGKAYRVFERKYAVFPQKSGTLEIPPFVVQVTVPSRQRSRSFFDPFRMSGERIKLRSEAGKIHVEEKPDEYPAQAVWLPASVITVDGKWSSDSREMKIGESTTVTLKLTAEGLLGEQLPPIAFPEIQGLKLYQGKAEVENVITSQSVIGVRRESIALIPTQAGMFEIPEIRIPWWNKTLDKVEYAVVAAKQIMVAGSFAGKETGEPVSQPVERSPQVTHESPLASTVAESKPTALIILCSALAICWLITLYLLVTTRRKLSLLAEEGEKRPEDYYALQEKEVFGNVVEACRENNPASARKAVMAWVRIFWPDKHMRTFSDVAQVHPDSGLVRHLDELDRILYDPGTTSENWQGKSLLEHIEEMRKVRKNTKEKKNPLEKLYK